MSYFLVEGGSQLHGEISISGAKNAALPMLCAALLTSEKCTFHNVPDIEDIATLLTIFEEMGVQVERDLAEKTVSVQARDVDLQALKKCQKVCKLRASILVLGPLLSRFGEAEIVQPGGCILGARPNFIHTDGFQTLGAEISRQEKKLSLTFSESKLAHTRLLLSEASVTGTENLAMFLAGKPETSEMYFCAAEPHVQATLRMLVLMGAQIEGIGTHHLKIIGTKKLRGGSFEIPPDGLLVGTYAIAGLLTKGELLIRNVDHTELFSFYGALKRIGAEFEMKEKALHVFSNKKLHAIPKLQTAIYPGFSTDLQSPFGVLLTQCEGESLIFETLFENRLTYLHELEKMGADVEFLNAHQAKVQGPVKLKGTEVQSWDLRAGAAMVLAGLVARGTTKVTNIQYIDRGYEHFEENLQKLGAKIERIN
ncbi:UDP-N-acetylglucosamine 1-carboxyvinyltransferase [Candidatus Gracilibacteria bacterium]|nr:UDP-N-acetylglucosamine 1-carboxyvinyltransferase [Candidatus Gracilibacteria bacterium]MCF7819691.1 UDP-N-acetylglucosamine 1-carboxyvinyltransferase [Candidatus Gracilibacteria bacterium]